MHKSVVMSNDADVEEVIETIGISDDDIDFMVDRAGKFTVVGVTVTLVLSLIISLLVFFGIVIRKKDFKSKFVHWLKEFLNFRRMWVVGILKYVYLFAATFLTIGGIVVMFYGGSEPWVMVLVGLGIISLGNLALRLGFEMSMVAIGMWENMRDVRNVLVDGVASVKKVEKTEKTKEEQE